MLLIIHLKTFITFHGVVLWNNLAINIKELSTLSKLKLVSTIFKMYIVTHLLNLFNLFIDFCPYKFLV